MPYRQIALKAVASRQAHILAYRGQSLATGMMLTILSMMVVIRMVM